jgi:hypothetical protein
MDAGLVALLLLSLLAAHCWADFVAQTEAMAHGKCPGALHPAAAQVPWYYWLAVHACMHGAAVGLVFRLFGAAPWLAGALWGAEAVAHALIDRGKCAGWYSIHGDQLLHLGCKFLWCAVFWSV